MEWRWAQGRPEPGAISEGLEYQHPVEEICYVSEGLTCLVGRNGTALLHGWCQADRACLSAPAHCLMEGLRVSSRCSSIVTAINQGPPPLVLEPQELVFCWVFWIALRSFSYWKSAGDLPHPDLLLHCKWILYLVSHQGSPTDNLPGHKWWHKIWVGGNQSRCVFVKNAVNKIELFVVEGLVLHMFH